MLAFEVLPALHRAISSDGLAAVVAEHLEQTRAHAARVEEAFRAVGAEPSSNLDEVTEKLAAHHDELAEQIPEERLRDAFHAAAAVATEHRELAAYEALLVLARALDADEAERLLSANRDEEQEALARLAGELERLTGLPELRR